MGIFMIGELIKMGDCNRVEVNIPPTNNLLRDELRELGFDFNPNNENKMYIPKGHHACIDDGKILITNNDYNTVVTIDDTITINVVFKSYIKMVTEYKLMYAIELPDIKKVRLVGGFIKLKNPTTEDIVGIMNIELNEVLRGLIVKDTLSAHDVFKKIIQKATIDIINKYVDIER